MVTVGDFDEWDEPIPVRLRTDAQIQSDVDNAISHEKRISDAMATEEMVREMHGWLAEIMPAIRVAIKMMNARDSLMRRWRGGKGQ